MNDWAILLGVIVSVVTLATPFLAWWGASRYFSGQWDAYLKNQQEWREGIGHRLDHIDAAIQQGSWPTVISRLGRAEQDILDLRRFKHEKVEPYVRALDVQRHEIDTLKQQMARRPSSRTRSDD